MCGALGQDFRQKDGVWMIPLLGCLQNLYLQPWHVLQITDKKVSNSHRKVSFWISQTHLILNTTTWQTIFFPSHFFTSDGGATVTIYIHNCSEIFDFFLSLDFVSNQSPSYVAFSLPVAFLSALFFLSRPPLSLILNRKWAGSLEVRDLLRNLSCGARGHCS